MRAGQIMGQDSDGIEEAFEGQLRVALTAAGRVAEIIARAREDAARRAQAGSEQEAREWSARLEAERVDARAQLAVVHQGAWWENPDAGQIAQVAQVAQVASAWAREDPEALQAREVMRAQLLERFGVDLDDAGGDPAAVREAVEHAQGHQRGSRASSTRAGQVQADRLVAPADATDTAAARSVPAWDSARRREETARALRSMGVGAEQVATAMLADVSQAKAAQQALTARVDAPVNASKKGRRGRSQVVRIDRGL